MALLSAGNNIAMKVPSHSFEATVRFYRDVIGLRQLDDQQPFSVFDFGGKKLWLDQRDDLKHAEIWLELATDDVQSAATHLHRHGVIRRDEVEELPEGFNGFWICNPAGIIHLVSGD